MFCDIFDPVILCLAAGRSFRSEREEDMELNQRKRKKDSGIDIIDLKLKKKMLYILLFRFFCYSNLEE